MISSLKYLVRDRKGKLLTYLNNNVNEIPAEKQYQLYGAIEELEFIMDTLHSHRNKEIEKEVNPDEIFLFRPIRSKGTLKSVTSFIKDLF